MLTKLKVKKLILLISPILFLTVAVGQTKINGTYIGLEKICWRTSKNGNCINTDNFNPKWKWYHQNIMKIKADSVFLDQNPISIYKKDTSYSASDGAFYYYSGILTKTNNTTFTIKLTEVFCDYCGERSEKQPDGTYKIIKRTKQFLCKMTSNGFTVDNALYKRTQQKENMISEHPQPFLKGN